MRPLRAPHLDSGAPHPRPEVDTMSGPNTSYDPVEVAALDPKAVDAAVSEALAAAFTKDGQRLAVSAADGSVKLFAVADGKQVGSIAAIAPIVIYLTERLDLSPTGYGIFLSIGSLGGLAGGQLDLGGVSTTGYGWLAGIAVVSTVGAVGLFFAGLQRVGPTAASILSTLEPVVTVGLAFAVFGESLGPAQLAGASLVLLGCVWCRVR